MFGSGHSVPPGETGTTSTTSTSLEVEQDSTSRSGGMFGSGH
jgi:hypothetical protein